jgi:tagatose 6-phosphate kinase
LQLLKATAMSRGFLIMTPHILTITLNPAIDRIIRHDRALPSDVLLAGGKGVNVARAAKALGVSVRAIGVAGGSAGHLLGELLDQERIAHAFSPIEGATRTNVTTVGKNGSVRRKVEPGPRMTKKERDAFALVCGCEIRRSSAVVFSGSLPLKFPVKEFASMLAQAQASGVITVVDTRGSALQTALDLGVDIIKPNREEAEDVLGFKLSSRAMIRKALRTFIGYGIKKVLISLGKDGLAASDGQKGLLVSLPVVTTGHAVGCGDAALAGFLSAHFKGKDLGGCAAYAAACGYANARADVPGGIIKKNIQFGFMRRKFVWL